jgi:hypothetical protein
MAKVKKKISEWVVKNREFECVGIQHRVTISTRRYMKVRVEGNPTKMVLKREPDNPHDRNAIAVYMAEDPDNPYKGVKVGYLRRKVSEVFAPLVDSGDLKFEAAMMTGLDELEGTGDLQVKFKVKRVVKVPLDKIIDGM